MREISSSQWEVQSCSQGALVFFLLSFGFRVGRLEGRVFFFKLYLVWRVDCKSMQVLLGAAGGAGRGGFIFLSANRRAQGAFLLFHLSSGAGEREDFFFSVFPVS
jgi:hypothetical protein